MSAHKIRYFDVQESFGMSGPYIGKLEFNGKVLDGNFLADNQKENIDRTIIVFSYFLNETWPNKREFNILVFDNRKQSFYRSKKSYESLSIESVENNLITFHLAFHTELKNYRQKIEFNDDNFIKLDYLDKNMNIESNSLDNNFISEILHKLEKKLNRPLTIKEKNAFSIYRSGIAFEMILDYISDENITTEKLEKYVKSVVKES